MAENAEGVDGDNGPAPDTARSRERLSDSDDDDDESEDIPRALGPHPSPTSSIPSRSLPGALDRSDSETTYDEGGDDSNFDDDGVFLLRNRLASRTSILPSQSNRLDDLGRPREDQLVGANESSPRRPSKVSPEPLSNKGRRVGAYGRVFPAVRGQDAHTACAAHRTTTHLTVPRTS